jgi:hypothetical protein
LPVEQPVGQRIVLANHRVAARGGGGDADPCGVSVVVDLLVQSVGVDGVRTSGQFYGANAAAVLRWMWRRGCGRVLPPPRTVYSITYGRCKDEHRTIPDWPYSIVAALKGCRRSCVRVIYR